MCAHVLGTRHTSGSEHCAVCGHGSNVGTVLLCQMCAHRDRIRTYCRSCHTRLDLSLEEAQHYFPELQQELTRTGIVFRFEKCPSCHANKEDYCIVQFDIDLDDFPPVLPT